MDVDAVWLTGERDRRAHGQGAGLVSKYVEAVGIRVGHEEPSRKLVKGNDHAFAAGAREAGDVLVGDLGSKR